MKKRRPSSIKTLLFILLLSLWVLPGDAYAYVDPGTGSFVLQLIVGALIGTASVIMVYWSRIKSFFKRLSPLSSKRGNEDPEANNV